MGSTQLRTPHGPSHQEVLHSRFKLNCPAFRVHLAKLDIKGVSFSTCLGVAVCTFTVQLLRNRTLSSQQSSGVFPTSPASPARCWKQPNVSDPRKAPGKCIKSASTKANTGPDYNNGHGAFVLPLGLIGTFWALLEGTAMKSNVFKPYTASRLTGEERFQVALPDMRVPSARLNS